MDLDTSLSSINFNNLIGGNSGFGLNQKTGDATLGFGARVAFFSKFLTVICCIIWGVYVGISMEKDSKKFTKKTTAQFYKINCTKSKVEKTERTGKRTKETREEIVYKCTENFRYEINGKIYESKMDRSYDHDKTKAIKEIKKDLNKTSSVPKVIDNNDYSVDLGDNHSYSEKEIYYNPENPNEYSVNKIEKGSGLSIVFSTLCCGIFCLIFLYYCYKDLGCRGFIAFNFFADTVRGNNDSDNW